MVTLAPAAPHEQNALRRLYLDAFPRAERKPFRLLCRQARRGRMELLTLHGEAGEPLGLAVTMLHESLVLLDYFAVAPAARGGGIGGEALGLLRERYAGRRFSSKSRPSASRTPRPSRRRCARGAKPSTCATGCARRACAPAFSGSGWSC